LKSVPVPVNAFELLLMPDQLLSISTDKNDYGQIRVLSASSDAPHNRVPSSNVVPRSNPLTRGDTGRRGRPEATDVSDSSAGLSFNRGQDCCRQWQRNATEPAQDMGATLPFVNVLPGLCVVPVILYPNEIRHSDVLRMVIGKRRTRADRFPQSRVSKVSASPHKRCSGGWPAPKKRSRPIRVPS
jgi:hypothetical protein